MNFLRRRSLFLFYLLAGAAAVYGADPDGVRIWLTSEGAPTPPVVHSVVVPGDGSSDESRGILRLAPHWTGGVLHSAGQRADLELPAEAAAARAWSHETQRYLGAMNEARAFAVSYRSAGARLRDWPADHPYHFALQRRRDDLELIAALKSHRPGDSASLAKLKSLRPSPESIYQNRELVRAVDALVKLETLQAAYPQPTLQLNQWLSSWDQAKATPEPQVEELKRRAADYRRFAVEESFTGPWAKLAEKEAVQAEELVQALTQLGRRDKTAALQNLQALRRVLSLLDLDQHPTAFAQARKAVHDWSTFQLPGELPLDKVWIGTPRKTAFERKDVRIEWQDGTLTTLDQPYRGIVYDEVELGRLDKAVRKKVTIYTPLGTGSLDDLSASEDTKYALAFNESVRKLKGRLAAPSSYRLLAEAFAGVHRAGARMEPTQRQRFAGLAEELERFQVWDR